MGKKNKVLFEICKKSEEQMKMKYSGTCKHLNIECFVTSYGVNSNKKAKEHCQIVENQLFCKPFALCS
jgi:hypothetical protein